MNSKTLNRRQFLVLAAGAASVGLIQACAPAAAPTAAPAPTTAPAAPAPTKAPAAAPTAAPAAPTAAPAAPTAAPADGEDAIWFAGIGPLTGANAELGQGLKRGIEWALEEINGSGGVNGKQMKADYFDDEAKPESAAASAQKIVSDPKYWGVIGHVNSSCSLAALPIYQKAGLVEISGNTNPTITKRGFKNYFRTVANDASQGPFIIQYAVNELKLKNIAIIYENSDYGKGLVDASKPEIEKLGAKAVSVETYTMGVDKDFSAVLTKIKAANPDVLLHFGNYGEGGAILAQAKKLGLDIPKIGAGGDNAEEIINLAGKDAIEGFKVFTFYNAFAERPAAKKLAELSQKKIQRMPNEYEAMNYEIPFIYKIAIEKGATKETMADVLHTVTYDGPSGVTKFDEFGDVIGKEQGIYVVKDGKMVPFR